MFAIYYSMVDFFIHGVDLLGGYFLCGGIILTTKKFSSEIVSELNFFINEKETTRTK